MGSAIETEDWSSTGVVLKRVETLKFLRGDAPVAMTTTIEIHADSALVPRSVTWAERGSQLRFASAHRDSGGWVIDDVPTDPRAIRGAGAVVDPRQRTRLETSKNAIPAELVPLYVRRDGRFAGNIFLPARAFVGGHGRIDAVAPGRLVARLELDVDTHDARNTHDARDPYDPRNAHDVESPTRVIAEATIDLARDGMPARVIDGEGVISMRASEAEVREPFALVDLVAATSIPLSGDRDPRRPRLALVGDLALPAVPGQLAHTRAAGLEVELSTSFVGALPAGPSSADRTAEIATLVARVQQRISPDLGASIATPRDASNATAGDCTTFALAYAAVARRSQIPTRVVTGLRVDRTADGERLARHRWAVSWTGTRWIAVDAAFGRVPAGGDLVGLALHDADDAGLIAGEAALAQVRAAAWTQ